MSTHGPGHGYAIVLKLFEEATRRFPPAEDQRHTLERNDSGGLSLTLCVSDEEGDEVSCTIDLSEDDMQQTPEAFIASCEARVIEAGGVVLPTITLQGAISAEEQDATGKYMALALGNVAQRFRWVEPGKFAMGSPKTEAGRWEDEGPVHEVELTRGYWMADTPVTQALWAAVMGRNPSRYKGADHPVERVSWDDCKVFLTRLNGMVPGLDARLPTEAEWENACRAGTTGATWVGELDIQRDGVRSPNLDAVAWYYANSPEGTRPVRGKAPNPLGLHDMLGNVYEWCEDWFGAYADGAVTDPQGPKEGSYRVVRGGCWFSFARRVRAASRYAYVPAARNDFLGFRLARGHQV